MRDNCNKFCPFLPLLLALLFIGQAFNYIFLPHKWGWPIEVRIKGQVLLLAMIIFAVISVCIYWIKLFARQKVMLSIGLFIVILAVGIRIILIHPKPSDVENRLHNLGLDQAKFENLNPCEKFEIFSEVSYHSLAYPTPSVLAPEWLHNSLAQIEKDIAIDCIIKVGMNELESINGEQIEISIAKMHVLVYEAFRLKLVYTPKIMDFLEQLILDGRVDQFEIIKSMYCGPLDLNSLTDGETIYWIRADLCTE